MGLINTRAMSLSVTWKMLHYDAFFESIRDKEHFAPSTGPLSVYQRISLMSDRRGEEESCRVGGDVRGARCHAATNACDKRVRFAAFAVFEPTSSQTVAMGDLG